MVAINVDADLKIDEARDFIAKTDLSSACFTCSFQAEDMAVLHLLQERRRDIPVLFLETGYHFREIYEYRDEMTARYGLNLINVMPKQTLAEHEAERGQLFRIQQDRCCGLRKVEPLFAALEDYEVWFTGLRRVQSPTRANLQVDDTFPLPSGKRIRKISVLAAWSDKAVWSYVRSNGIPLVSLYDAGYTSIGCQPCTALPADAANLRSGRWAGRKLECGIHIADGGH